MKKYLFAILFFLISISCLAQVIPPIGLKKHNVLGVCAYTEFTPIIYGKYQGYEPDLLRAVAKLWHVNIKFYPQKIYEGIWKLPSSSYNLCDVSAGGITPALYRSKQGSVFSNITTHFSQSLLIRKEDFLSNKITSYKSFQNSPLKIGVVPGTTGEKYAHIRAKENHVQQSVFVQYPSESDLLPALKNKKIDAIARGEVGNDCQALMNSNFLTIDRKSFGEGFAFSINRSNKALKIALDEAIKIVTDSGKITYQDWIKNPSIFNDRVNSYWNSNG